MVKARGRVAPTTTTKTKPSSARYPLGRHHRQRRSTRRRSQTARPAHRGRPQPDCPYDDITTRCWPARCAFGRHHRQPPDRRWRSRQVDQRTGDGLRPGWSHRGRASREGWTSPRSSTHRSNISPPIMSRVSRQRLRRARKASIRVNLASDSNSIDWATLTTSGCAARGA